METSFAKRMEMFGDDEVLDPNSLAIVRVSEKIPVSAVAVPPKRRYEKRLLELDRVTNLGVQDVVRKT
ncbi:Histone-lysine N-methyltransferase member suvh2 [Sarracenia purpurea var. burkii]